MSKKNKASGNHKPLYYITQPKLQQVTAPSQTTYIVKSTKKVHEQKQIQEEEVSEKEIRRSDVASYMGELRYVEKTKKVKEKDNHVEKVKKEVEKISGELDEVKNETDQESFGRKSFKDMTIEEKVEYLLNKPFYIPDISVIIVANDQEYVGYVKSYTNGVIDVKQLHHLEPLTLLTKDITEMRINTKI